MDCFLSIDLNHEKILASAMECCIVPIHTRIVYSLNQLRLEGKNVVYLYRILPRQIEGETSTDRHFKIHEGKALSIAESVIPSSLGYFDGEALPY